jgi:nucleotide-binding universal stress UspA family protein
MSVRNSGDVPTKATPFEVARHLITQAHRERVRLRRSKFGLPTPGPIPVPRAAQDGAPVRVVVGVDGSDASRRALNFAAREASAHGGLLTVCWTGAEIESAGSSAGSQPASARGDLDRIEEELLAVVAAAAPYLDPDVRMVPSVLGAKPDELADFARSADLLVLARPYERHLSRQSLGEMRRLIRHARCPVMLVP